MELSKNIQHLIIFIVAMYFSVERIDLSLMFGDLKGFMYQTIEFLLYFAVIGLGLKILFLIINTLLSRLSNSN